MHDNQGLTFRLTSLNPQIIRLKVERREATTVSRIQEPTGRQIERSNLRANSPQSPQSNQQGQNKVDLQTQIEQLIACVKADGCESSKNTLQQLVSSNPQAKTILEQMASNRQDEQTAQIAREVLSQTQSQRDQAEGVRTLAHA